MNTNLGIKDNILAALGYIIPIIAIVIYVAEKENDFVKFHSLQSIFFSLILVVIFTIASVFSCFLQFIPRVGTMLSCICWTGLVPFMLGAFAIAIFLAIKAYNREHYKLPYIGDQVEKIIFKY
ncbi:MAG: DUF4870 domain-containing protein [Candidatus Calescibacterium sp.]|nr:DUF4870 domain-containing protein [Candidatus Calescibacterium sp.]MDW8133161.1 DUF4870 domain-containing protein [Candidatus Calescibacterium sp.]